MATKTNKTEKKFNFSDYLIMSIFLVVIAAGIFMSYYSNSYVNRYIDIVQENLEKRLLTEGKAIGNLFTANELQSYQTVEDMDKYSYINLHAILVNYAKAQDLAYIYVYRFVEGKAQYIVDSSSDTNTSRGLAYFEPLNQLMFQAYGSQMPIVSTIGDYSAGRDGFLSAHVPVFDKGTLIAMVGVDISDEEIVRKQEEVNRLSYLSISVIGVAALAIIGVIASYREKVVAYYKVSISKGQFLSKMSHEIRTPMNAVIGFCRMAKNTQDTAKKNEYIENVNVSSNYLLELINEALDISKIEASKMSLNKENASIYEMVSDIEKIMISQATAKNQKLLITIDDNIPKYLSFDKTRLSQIIINLISNSLKFTPEGGTVSLDILLSGTENNVSNLLITIKDTGIGMDEKTLDKLFEPFEQATSTTAKIYGGTGLGLTISKHLIEQMGGIINVTSKPGEGSIFAFNVLLDNVKMEDLFEIETESENKLDTNKSKKIDCTGMRFLIAEDNNINQIIARDVFEGFGAEVEIVNNGVEALNTFKQNPDKYSIIFMDVQMPVMDGVEATKAIRSLDIPLAQTIPIVAMTADVFQEDIDNTINAGMNAHLGKPLDLEKIVLVIKKVLEK